jgi:hypothetical protein
MQSKWSHNTKEIPAHQYLLQHYSQELRYRVSQGACQQTNGKRKYGIYAQWDIIQLQRMSSCHLQ